MIFGQFRTGWPSLRKNIRIELALERMDLVFQQEFLFFQPAHAQLVGQRVFRQARDRIVEVAMLDLQFAQAP